MERTFIRITGYSSHHWHKINLDPRKGQWGLKPCSPLVNSPSHWWARIPEDLDINKRTRELYISQLLFILFNSPIASRSYLRPLHLYFFSSERAAANYHLSKLGLPTRRPSPFRSPLASLFFLRGVFILATPSFVLGTLEIRRVSNTDRHCYIAHEDLYCR